MSYLNLDLDYLDHPQTVMLVALLGPGAELIPLRLWIYCGKFHSQTGRLPKGHTISSVENIFRWNGTRGAAVQAMLADGVDYLGQDHEGIFYAKNWKKHQGHIYSLKIRGQELAKIRWDAIRNAGSNAVRIAAGNAIGNAPAVPTNHKEKDLPSALKNCKNGCNIKTSPKSVYCPACIAVGKTK